MDQRYRRPPLAAGGMTIGLLGGSFNPPHEGHRHISKTALKRLGLDRLWWLVTPANPIKAYDHLTGLDERMRMSEEVARHPRIDVNCFESSLPSVFTVETVKRLQRRYPDTGFVWLMGADNLKAMHNWHHWQGLFSLLPIAIIDRPGERYKALSSRAAHMFRCYYRDESDARGFALLRPPAWTFLTIPLSPLSSTAIRHEIAYLPDRV